MKYPNIENWWAVQAMIASYNHVYQVVYDTGYVSRGIGRTLVERALQHCNRQREESK